MSRPILITGATGKQGGAVIDALLRENADFQILAVTRDAFSGGAQKLKAKSSKIQIMEPRQLGSTRGDLRQCKKAHISAYLGGV